MVAAEKNCIFKLYFQNESDCDDADDVRKVVLGQPKTQLSLETVVNKIDQLSILGLEPDFTIQYCDQDGDKVTIGNTEELQNALNDQKCEPFKFYIKPRRKNKSPAEIHIHGRGEEHPGIICTCCHGPIIGFRYKCVTCINYDLCQRCEAKGTHPAHDVLRIASATRIYPRHFFTRFQRMYDKVYHPQSSHSISSNGSKSPGGSALELMAKDLVDLEDHYDLEDVDLESNASTFMTADETVRPESAILPSIEELTKSVQNLTEKGLDDDVDDQKVLLVVEEGESSAKVECKQKEEQEDKAEDLGVLVAEKQQSTLSKLQEEIDKLLAPLTPRLTPSITTPREPLEAAAEEEIISHDLLNQINEEVSEEVFEEVFLNNKELDNIKATAEDDVTEIAKETNNISMSEVVNDDDKLELSDNDQPKLEISASSSFSSSPFDLCDVPAMNEVITETAIIEQSTRTYKSSPKKDSRPAAIKNSNDKLMQDMDTIITLDSETVEEPFMEPSEDSEKFTEPLRRWKTEKETSSQQETSNGTNGTSNMYSKDTKKDQSPLPDDEAQALLKIVEEQDRLDRHKTGGVSLSSDMDPYMLASSRLMLRKQLRQETICKSIYSTDLLAHPNTRSSTMNYSTDTYDYRSPYTLSSSTMMSRSLTLPEQQSTTSSRSAYSSRPLTYQSSYSTPNTYERLNSSTLRVSDAVGQMKSMGFTDEEGWLTQLCTLKRGNIEQVLDVLTPVNK